MLLIGTTLITKKLVYAGTKNDMADRTDYKNAVLDYLKKHRGENITRNLLISATKISKSRLTEILQSIRSDGYTIVTPPRSGIVRLESGDSQLMVSDIKDSDIRCWLIIFLLSIHEKLSFTDLLMKLIYMRDITMDQKSILLKADSNDRAYDDSTLIKNIRSNASFSDDPIKVAEEIVSVTALRKDLKTLRDRGLILMSSGAHTEYRLSGKAPQLITVSSDSLFEFCQKYSETVSSTSELAPLKQAFNRIGTLIDYVESDIKISRFGKTNGISSDKIERFNSFVTLPYKTKQLQIRTRAKNTSDNEAFAVGLIYYSVESANFYLLGKNMTSNQITNIRIDQIEEVIVLKEDHKEFHAEKYYAIYDEMFSSRYERKPHKVKVLFTNFSNVPKRFSDLHMVRPGSSIRLITDKPDNCPYDYVYEDTIRGLTDFARYLRSFGTAVLALEPPTLVDKMCFTFNRIVERYEGGNLYDKE